MKYIILVKSLPHSSNNRTAYNFTKALHKANVSVTVYLLADGVYSLLGSTLWEELAGLENIKLVACPGASQIRNVTPQIDKVSLIPFSRISEEMESADKVVSFN